jgi:hypothetical protein
MSVRCISRLAPGWYPQLGSASAASPGHVIVDESKFYNINEGDIEQDIKGLDAET